MLIILSLGIALGINALLFLIAYNKQSDKLTDFAYTLSFITVTIAAITFSTQRSPTLWIIASMVMVWALRLGIFLVYRIRKSGHDSRFDDIRQHFFKFLQFWLGQGIVAWILLLPLLMAGGHKTSENVLLPVGIFIWLVGFGIESIADLQKYRFNQNPKNKGRWIDQGLWHYSRHPNYFGEILVWAGVYIAVYSVLSGSEQLIGLISPLTIFISLMFISGVPILERAAHMHWGNDNKYQEYRRRTSLLIPWWRTNRRV